MDAKKWFVVALMVALVVSLGLTIACGDDDDDDATDDDATDDDATDDDAADDDATDDDATDDDATDDDATDDDDTVDEQFGEIIGYTEIEYAEDLVCQGDYCYVCAKETGLVTVDVSDRANPTIIVTNDTVGKAWNAVFGGYNGLFVADQQGGLVRFAVGDPAEPAEIWTYTSANATTINEVAVLPDNTIYIGGGDGLDGWFEVLSDPTGSGPSVTGSLAITGEACVSLVCEGADCFCGGGEGNLYYIDATNPADPQNAGSFFDPGTAEHEPWGLGLTLEASTLYYSDWGAGIFALDAGGLPALTELSHVATGDGVYDSAVAGKKTIDAMIYDFVLAVANSQGGLALIDANDLTNMTLIGEPLDVTAPGEMADGPHGVVVMGNHAYLADNMQQGLVIVRITE